MTSAIPVVFFCNTENVGDICVAIESMRLAGAEDTCYDIYLLAADFSSAMEAVFKEFSDHRTAVHVIRHGAESVREIGADLLEDLQGCDQILCLKGALLIRDDLSALSQTELGDRAMAAVPLFGGAKNHKAFAEDVVLLNLARLRAQLREGQPLAWNDADVMPLSLRFALPAEELIRNTGKWTPVQIQERYGTTYPDEAGVYTDAAIVCLSGIDKPWENGPFSDEWYRAYLNAPIDHDIVRDSARTSDSELPKISVIMPVYNAEDYIRETMECVLNQTLQDIEVICVDDGSTDGSLRVLQELAADSRVQVYHQENRGQGAARNFAMTKAKGKYIYFMDSDDLLDSDTLACCYRSAEWNSLDLVLFEGESFYDESELEQQHAAYKTLYHRSHFYPDVYSGSYLFALQSRNWDFIISPCMRLQRRDYLVDNGIFFPEGIVMEDNFFAFRSTIEARRVKVLHKAFYQRRLRAGSTMTSSEAAYRKYVGYHTTACLILDYLKDHELETCAFRAAAFRVFQYLESANSFYAQLTEAQIEAARKDPAVRQLDYQLLELVLRQQKEYFFDSVVLDTGNTLRSVRASQFYRDYERLRVQNRQLIEEKRRRWEEMQALRAENNQMKYQLGHTGLDREGVLVLRISPKLAGVIIKVKQSLQLFLKKLRRQ